MTARKKAGTGRLAGVMAVCLLLWLCLSPALVLADGLKPTQTPALAPLDALVERGITEQRYPGAVLVVRQKGRTLWSRAYGRMTYAPDSPPMRLDTLFDLASISKVAGTSLAAMLLLDAGKLRLDDPVAKYLPGFEANGKGSVTVRDLLTHVSGLKAYESREVVEKLRQPDETHADALLRRYDSLPFAYSPRSKVVYSCVNMQTLAYAVERLAGQPLEEFLRTKVWSRLGMRDTTYRPDAAQRARCAPTGLRADGTPIQGEVHDPLANYHGSDASCPGNAGLFSTAGDLARYAELILAGGAYKRQRILSAETARQMTAVQTPADIKDQRGLGWDIYRSAPYATSLNHEQDTLTFGHTGYTGTFLWLDKRSKTCIVFLTNRVFHSPATGGREGAAIAGIQRALCDTVLRSLPEYRQHFAAQQSH